MSKLCGWVLLAVRLPDISERHGVVFKAVRGSRMSHSVLSSCLGKRVKRHTVNGLPRKTIALSRALSRSRLVTARMNLIQLP